MVGKFSFYMHQRGTEEAQTFSAHRVFTILPHQELLQNQARKRLVNKIKQLSQAPEEYFKALYLPVIEKFADYTQSLPDVRTYATPHSSQWLDSALARSAYALTIRHRVTLPHHGTEQEVQREYALWSYVVFTSCLLWHIGKLATHYFVSLCDEQGKVTKHWHPMTQSLFIAGSHYKIRSIDKNGPDTFKHMTSVLARTLMPQSGFEWIASNEKALEYWLLALIEDGGSQSKLLYIHELARRFSDEHPDFSDLGLQLNALDKKLDLFERDLNEINDIEKALQDGKDLPPVKIIDPPETKMGEDFVQWLRRGIANHSIAINTPNAHVHVSPDGVVLAYPEIFQDFCSMFYRNRDWIVVYKQFNYLGLAKKSGTDTWFGKFFVDPQQTASQALSPAKQRELSDNKPFKGLLVDQARALYSRQNTPAANPQLRQESMAHVEADYPKLHNKHKKQLDRRGG